MSLAASYVTGTDEYAAFVKAAFQIGSQRIVAGEAPGAAPNAEALVFFNARRRIILPPNTPYIPVKFNATPTNKRVRLDRMWASCGGLLADQILNHGLGGQISFPPEITDVRPFLWKGFSPALRYTFLVDLPYDESQMDPPVKKHIAKALAAGLVCRRATRNDFPALVDCIQQTEARQGFSYGLNQSVLEQGWAILGEDRFRIYIIAAQNGAIASSRIILHATGGPAIDWIAATSNEHLRSGATQALIRFALDDLQASGASLFDFGGAGLPTVSAAKASWGGRLIPYLAINQESFRSLAIQMYLRLKKRRGAATKKPSEVRNEEPKSAVQP